MKFIANPPWIFESCDSCLSHVTASIDHPNSILDTLYPDFKQTNDTRYYLSIQECTKCTPYSFMIDVKTLHRVLGLSTAIVHKSPS
jgi:hypothetical protein